MAKSQRSLLIAAGALFTVMLMTGMAHAAENSFKGRGLIRFDTILTTALRVIGTTRLDGVILNGTKTGKQDNPVTIGDDLRVDGRIYRGKQSGPTDSQPLILNDNVSIIGTLAIAGKPAVTEPEFVVLNSKLRIVRVGRRIFVARGNTVTTDPWYWDEELYLAGLPTDQVISMDLGFAITRDGHGWHYAPDTLTWRDFGVIPGLSS
jgi:hypothetical protein